MKKSLLFAAFIAATPVALTLTGCSGGGGFGSFSPTAAPPTPTSTTQTTNFTLGNGQRAILTTIKTGLKLSGTLQIVPTPVAAAKSVAAIPFQFGFGSYAITGTVTAGGAFKISGNFGSQGAFSMEGQLQTATSDGSYTLKVGGQTETGVLPKSGPTTGPTTPPVGGNYKLTGNLNFSSVTAGSDIVSTPVTSFNDITAGGQITNITLATVSAFKGQALALNGQTGRVTGNGTSRLFGLSLASYVSDDIFAGKNKPFSVGQEILFSANNTNLLQVSQVTVQGTAFSTKVWRATGGSFIIRAIESNSASVELKNVRVDPSPIFGGVGSFTLNGTLSGTGLTVKTQ